MIYRTKYGKEFLGEGYKKIGDGLYRSADGLRTMHFDLTHHMYKGVPSATHINLYTAKATTIAGRYKIIRNIHIFFL